MRRVPIRSLVVLVACGLAAGAGMRVARHLKRTTRPDRFRGEVHRPYAGYVPEEDARG